LYAGSFEAIYEGRAGAATVDLNSRKLAFYAEAGVQKMCFPSRSGTAPAGASEGAAVAPPSPRML